MIFVYYDIIPFDIKCWLEELHNYCSAGNCGF